MNLLLVHIWYTSITLALLFGGYSMISEYMTTIYGNIGFYSYFIIYLSNVLGSFISPFLAMAIGVKWSIYVGALTYFIWMAIFNLKSSIIILLVSVINGIGSAIMRSQQSVWITSLPIKDKLGYYIGIYNAVFNFNGIFAGTISITILFFKFKLESLIWIFVLIGFVSMIMLLFVKKVPLTDEHFIDKESFIIMLKDKTFMLLYPIIIFQSFGIIFTYAVLPIFMEENDLAIAIMFLVYSIASAICSYVIGILCDKISSAKLIGFICINSVISTVYIYLVAIIKTMGGYEDAGNSGTHNHNYAYAYIVSGIFCAINDSGINGILLYIMSKYYKNKTVFSIHRAIFSIFCAIYAAVAPFIPWYINSILYNPPIICGLYTFTFYNKKISKNVEENNNLVETMESEKNDKTNFVAIELDDISSLGSDPVF